MTEILDKRNSERQMKPATWRFGPLTGLGATLTTATVLTAAGLVLAGGTWLGPHGDSAMAREFKEQPGRTQSGARVDFSSSKDWNLKAENLVTKGHNPLYFPLQPGFRYIMEHPNHPHGFLRIEVQVLDKTEPFDVPGIGKFDCGVVQEEEFYDGVLDQRAENWFCMDKATNSMYTFGEVSWEIDQVGRKVFAGTWRAGDPDGNGIAEPGLLMPGTFAVGDKYIFDGHEAEAYGFTENMEKGITITVPAGTFKDCVRTREYSLTNPSDITDKWWCPGVGTRQGHLGWRTGCVRCIARHGHGELWKTPSGASEANCATGCKSQLVGRDGHRTQGSPRQGHVDEDREIRQIQCLRRGDH